MRGNSHVRFLGGPGVRKDPSPTRRRHAPFTVAAAAGKEQDDASQEHD